MISDAIAVTRWFYGDPPELGMVTFVDPDKVRHKRDPGRCYKKAGFKHVGETKGGLLAFQLLPEYMPAPEGPVVLDGLDFGLSANPSISKELAC